MSPKLGDFIKEAVNLKIKYSKEADILLIGLRDGAPKDSIDLTAGVILHLDSKGLPLEIELLDASKITMLDEIIKAPIGLANIKVEY
ncbi:MAG: DUF2283 domain-containing protein [Nitrospirae bacterium]|nr:DUF2283 domain-containing protein [Nitrospirota bacterium]